MQLMSLHCDNSDQCAIAHYGSCHSPRVYILSPGLLQFTSVWSTRQLIKKLQSVQNAAARLITGTRRCEHITAVLRELHWLPVRQCVDFKVACLAHCLVRHLSISRQTSNSSPTVVAVISVQHLTGDASFPARRIPSATEVFASLDDAFGTGFLGV